jgi:arylsulfatase A-like enzyme
MSNNYSRRNFVKSGVFGAAASMTLPLTACNTGDAQKKPNILYIMSDDHAANAIASYDTRLAKVTPTSNIDRIANEGIRLNRCFCTNSICTPSRAAILTGKYSQKNGVFTLADTFNGSQPHVGKYLQQAGYQTAIIGKWHLKTDPTGFDYWNVLPGQGRYHNSLLKEIGTGKLAEHEGYSADIIGGLALDHLKNRDKDKPFYMMCHFKAPHGLWEYAERFEHLFDDVEIPEPESLFEDKDHRSDATRERGSTISPGHFNAYWLRTQEDKWPTGRLDTEGMIEEQKTRAAYQKYLKDYLRAVAGINDNVGKLLDYLDAEGLADDTVVMYTSDQGQLLGEHDYYDKRWMYEESLKMPFLVRYPREIKAGAINDDITLNIDFAPTFMDYAGVSTPSDMQGRSMRANLSGNTPGDWRESMYYRYWMHLTSHDNPAHYGVRTKDYKLIFFYGLPLDAKGAVEESSQPAWELYDLRKDPNELNNVYENPQYASVVAELKQELTRLKQEVGDKDEKYPELMAVREQYWD